MIFSLIRARYALTRITETGLPDGHKTLTEVVTCTAAVDPPAYSTIINLDMRLRELRRSDDARAQDPGNLIGYPVVSLGSFPLLERYVMLNKITTALMYLHRAFFVRAIRDDPVNPASSVYGPSFHATVRSVREIIDWLFSTYNANPDVAICLAYEWTMGVTAAVRTSTSGCDAIEAQRRCRWSTPV
jgi:hypothetical protein